MLGIGEKLRAARLEEGLSLRELAAMTDVSASLLSQIENGKTTPSVRTLHSIADALALPIDYFFPKRTEPVTPEASQAADAKSDMTASQMRLQTLSQDMPSSETILEPGHHQDDDPQSPVVRAADRAVIELEGNVTWARLTPEKERHIEFMEICYQAGASSGLRMSHHVGREFTTVIEGELTLELGFDQYVLAPGDSVIFDSATPHRLSNQGDSPMRAISVIFDL